MKKRKTAGELSLKAASDSTKYDHLEVSNAILDDVVQQLMICAERHKSIFDEEEFCVVMILANDPLIKGIKRKKFYGFLHLPQPRPEQAVFLYKKKDDSLKRLWCLPNAKVMAVISEKSHVNRQWKTTKGWCDAFFDGFEAVAENGQINFINKDPSVFFNHIRHQHNIKMLSESEYLNANREKLIKSGCQDVQSTPTDAFDFSKVSIDKIVDTKTALI